MRALTPADLFTAWEAALPLEAVPRALALAALVAPPAAGDPAALTIGRRDALLVALRARAFGPRLQGQIACPACATDLEIALDARTLQALAPHDPPASVVVARAGYVVEARPATSADLLTLEGTDIGSNARRLACRCVVSATRDGREVLAPSLPEDVIEEMAGRLAEADPLGDVSVATACPGCGHEWNAPFDIAAFLWTELHAWACRLLREIHVLASAYGWREADVLALSPLRRRAYLDLTGA